MLHIEKSAYLKYYFIIDWKTTFSMQFFSFNPESSYNNKQHTYIPQWYKLCVDLKKMSFKCFNTSALNAIIISDSNCYWFMLH